MVKLTLCTPHGAVVMLSRKDAHPLVQQQPWHQPMLVTLKHCVPQAGSHYQHAVPLSRSLNRKQRVYEPLG